MTNNNCKITHISDTHGYHKALNLEGGDILIHSGDILDFENKIRPEEIIDWLQKTPYDFKIIVIGNHDQHLSTYNLPENIILLDNSFIKINDITFYGLTGTLTEPHSRYLFAELSDSEIEKELKDINFDILITHGPPMKILDKKGARNVGSKSLLSYVKKKRPKYHLFGHAHHSNGTFSDGITIFSNASIVHSLLLKTLGGNPFNFVV